MSIKKIILLVVAFLLLLFVGVLTIGLIERASVDLVSDIALQQFSDNGNAYTDLKVAVSTKEFVIFFVCIIYAVGGIGIVAKIIKELRKAKK